MSSERIKEMLFSLQDINYRDFSASLIPNVDKQCVIGVRIPKLRALAVSLMRDAYKTGRISEINAFLSDLPHEYFEENNLHAFLLSEIKSFDECVEKAEAFLPFVDNWATCDSFRPKCFISHKTELLPYIDKWLYSPHIYTSRFAIEMLMVHFLDDSFNPDHMYAVSKIVSDEYYLNMMIAWYFATALAKQKQAALSYIEDKKLSTWVHNKTIQKAIESYRISPELKEYLKSLKIK